MDMVERVARALLASESAGELDWEKVSLIDRGAFKRDARAAIAAMREPTEGMVQATLPRYSKHNPGDEPYQGEMEEYWRLMITAALGED